MINIIFLKAEGEIFFWKAGKNFYPIYDQKTNVYICEFDGDSWKYSVIRM